MKFKGTIIGAASGSVNGLTFSHNAGGQYIRNRATPTNPNTPRQVALRAAMGALVNIWSNILSAAQRDAWNTYAANVPIIDRLGEPRNIGGLGHFLRSNIPRRQVGLATVLNGPTVFNLAELTEPTIVGVNAGSPNADADIGFTNTDLWATQVGGALLVYSSADQNPSINYYRGPYRFAGRVNGAVVPPTSPATVTLPYASTAGRRVHFQFRATNADARLSLPINLFGVSA